MNNVFDITAYGAVGDGVTDSTAAIQQALDDAAAVEGKVIVPPGKYLTGRLKMGVRTRLEGSSAWNFRKDGLSVFILNDPKAVCLLDITGAFGCSVSGMCFDGKNLGEGCHGIYLRWDRYNGGSEEDTPTIDDCRVGHFSGDSVRLEHIWCFSVRHSMLHSNGGAGLYIDGWDAFILDNWFTGNRKCGILGGPCTASVTANGNRIEWNRVAGIWFVNGDSVNLSGNFFDRSFGPGLKLGGGGEFRDAAVTGNVFRRSGCPDGMRFGSEYDNSHLFFDGVKNAAVTGNVFKWGFNDDGGGTKSPDYGAYIARSDAVVFEGNAMRDAAVKESVVYDGEGDCCIRDNMK